MKNLSFIHSTLDDAELPAGAFRVYCHVLRRAGAHGAWPSIRSIAHTCRLHPQSVRKSLKQLVAWGMLSVEHRVGMTTVYRPLAPSEWSGSRIARGRAGSDSLGSSGSDVTPKSLSAGPPTNLGGGPPLETEVAKGNPKKGNPRKEGTSYGILGNRSGEENEKEQGAFRVRISKF